MIKHYIRGEDEKEPIKELEWYLEREGKDIVLKCMGDGKVWSVLKIFADGTSLLVCLLSDSIGLDVDERGRLNVR